LLASRICDSNPSSTIKSIAPSKGSTKHEMLKKTVCFLGLSRAESSKLQNWGRIVTKARQFRGFRKSFNSDELQKHEEEEN
jgi:hypothetical protein